jgi:excisionase family DNA binding protein
LLDNTPRIQDNSGNVNVCPQKRSLKLEERHLSLTEVAGSLGVSERTVRRWIKAGKLRAYKPGRDYRIPASAVRELIEESEISPKALAPPSLFNNLEEERREDPEDLALDAAKRQYEEDTADRTEAWASEESQPMYFKQHENAAVQQLLGYPADQLAGALIGVSYRYAELEARYAESEARRAELAQEGASLRRQLERSSRA